MTSIKRYENNSHYQRKAIEAALAGGFIPDGETGTVSYRAKAGEIALKLVAAGGRQRFKKPDTAMKVTIGRISVCFYEVADGATKNMVTFSTRDTSQIEFWSKSEICFMRRDADVMGRGPEWVERNPHLVEAAARFQS